MRSRTIAWLLLACLAWTVSGRLPLAAAGAASALSVPATPPVQRPVDGRQLQVDPPGDVRMAGSFEDIGASLIGVSNSTALWGDYDVDGDLDILLTGSIGTYTYTTRIYRNDGLSVGAGWTFTDIEARLADVSYGSAWGDYDNDGDLDILLTGYDGVSKTSRLYRNDGGDVFTDTHVSLVGVSSGAVAWGDYDNDGDADILLTGVGNTSGQHITRVYRNDGLAGGDSWSFTDIDAALPDVGWSCAAWGDYDNDGWLDVLLSGGPGPSGAVAGIYHNDGPAAGDGWSFDAIDAPLVPVRFCSGGWGDYDADGDLDVLLMGDQGGGPLLGLYRNDAGTFTPVDSGLIPATSGSAAWGDYDNDGDLDVLLMGNTYSGASLVARVYRNDGDSTFSDVVAGLEGVVFSSAAWGDYDNDGDLDILQTGCTAGCESRLARIYSNNAVVANTVPSAPTPTSLSAVVNGRDVTLSWGAAVDGQTPAAGLSYNLRVGTTPGGSQVLPPLALASGYRQVPALGNANHRLSALLSGLPEAVYYWSVQAIDGAWAGSPFAVEGRFVVGRPWRVYLPVALRNFAPPFPGPWEAEPNDDALTQANGPIVSGTTYYGTFPGAADPKDYFYFDLLASHTVELWLTDVPIGNDYDLTLRDASLDVVQHSGNTGDADEHILSGTLAPGRYYVQVSNRSGPGSTQPYQLRVVYR